MWCRCKTCEASVLRSACNILLEGNCNIPFLWDIDSNIASQCSNILSHRSIATHIFFSFLQCNNILCPFAILQYCNNVKSYWNIIITYWNIAMMQLFIGTLQQLIWILQYLIARKGSGGDISAHWPDEFHTREDLRFSRTMFSC